MSILSRIAAATAALVKNAATPDWSTLERYITWAFGGGPSASGISVTPLTAMQSGAVYACVKVLSESVGMLPCNLQRKISGPNAWETADTHPVFSLLHDQPNDYQTAVEFWEMMVAHCNLRGNGYAFINRGSMGNVAELLPQHPDSVKSTLLSDYTMKYELLLPDGTYKMCRPGEVFHIRGLTLNGWLGISPIAYQRESIGLALAAEKFGGMLFRNGAKMGGTLEHPGKISDVAYARIKESFDQATSGENAHKTALLEEGMKFNKVSMTSEDAQFLETRKYQRSEIAAVFRVPPHKIGDLEKATFSNIEQQSLDFVNDGLMPWLVRIEKAVKRDLLGIKDAKNYRLKFNVFGLLRGDSKGRSDYYKSGINDGWLTRNEARMMEAELGFTLNALPKLDDPLIPLNMRSVNDPLPVPALAAPKPGDKPGADDVEDPADKKDPAEESDTAKAVQDLAHAIATQPPPTVIINQAPVEVTMNERKASRFEMIFDENKDIIGATPVFEEIDS